MNKKVFAIHLFIWDDEDKRFMVKNTHFYLKSLAKFCLEAVKAVLKTLLISKTKLVSRMLVLQARRNYICSMRKKIGLGSPSGLIHQN